MQEERLSVTRALALQRGPHELLVVLADERLHRPPALGRRLDHADVPDPAIDICSVRGIGVALIAITSTLKLQLAQHLLLLDAEALLLVDDQQAEILGADVP